MENPHVTALELSLSAISDAFPPAGISIAVHALWFARAGKWDAAHDLCQDIPGETGSWIHAYLHREEGDLSNAAYWYSRAHKPTPPSSLALEDEWLAIAAVLLLAN